MKKLMAFVAVAAMAVPAMAELQFKSIETIDGTTVIALEDSAAGGSVNVSAAFLHNEGKKIYARGLQCGLTDGVASYKVIFPAVADFEDTTIELTINGETVTKNIYEDIMNAPLQDPD